MKTKVIFSPEDFKGAGQLIIRDSFPVGCTDYSFGITVAYKIGFIIHPKKKGGIKYLIISLSDGMALEYASLEDLCKKLNSDSYGYRPMTRHEIDKIIVSRGSGFSHL